MRLLSERINGIEDKLAEVARESQTRGAVQVDLQHLIEKLSLQGEVTNKDVISRLVGLELSNKELTELISKAVTLIEMKIGRSQEIVPPLDSPVIREAEWFPQDLRNFTELGHYRQQHRQLWQGFYGGRSPTQIVLWHPPPKYQVYSARATPRDLRAELAVTGAQINKHLRNAIKNLPPQQQAFLHLAYVEEMQIPEIAKLTGVSPQMVETTLRSAVQALEDNLESPLP